MVLEVAGSIGFVRETNYGRLFDVEAKVDPANLAYTALAIAPHTDNPYRDPVPTVQLLHCLARGCRGRRLRSGRRVHRRPPAADARPGRVQHPDRDPGDLLLRR